MITKFFKSDVDLTTNDFQENIDDKNIYNLWNKYALKRPLEDLNPENDYNENMVSNKKIVTHRIVNLKTLTEVFNN